MMDEPVPAQPVRRIRYYLGRAEDALDSSASELHQTRTLEPGWRDEVLTDLAVLRGKLDVLRTLMNGR